MGFVRVALRNLRLNALRSALTMLGIVIGVASVTAMLGIGAGAQARIAEQIRSLGANVLMVQPAPAPRGGGGAQRSNLTEADAAAIARQVFQVTAAAPSVRGNTQAVRGNRNWHTTVNGTTADYMVVREWSLSGGRVFSRAEEEQAGKVALIGATVAEQLFGEANPVGQNIRILSVPFLVIGVLNEKGPSGSGKDQDDIVFIPISTMKTRVIGSGSEVDRGAVQYILVKVASDAAVPAAQRHIVSLLRQRHRLGEGQESDFRVTDPAAAMAAQHESTRIVSWLLLSVASVSLLVGGISIMNIMLVSVAERTREIGLRLAVGARRKDIRRQFLTEALILCLFGGLAGLALGAAISVGVGRLAGWPIFIAPDAALIAVGFAGAVGLFFGWFPALKASRMNPISALRYE